jgi:hypothetical protein
VAVIPAVSFDALAGTLSRTPLAVLPTPLVAAPRLAAALGTGSLLSSPMRTEGLLTSSLA